MVTLFYTFYCTVVMFNCVYCNEMPSTHENGNGNGKKTIQILDRGILRQVDDEENNKVHIRTIKVGDI